MLGKPTDTLVSEFQEIWLTGEVTLADMRAFRIVTVFTTASVLHITLIDVYISEYNVILGAIP